MALIGTSAVAEGTANPISTASKTSTASSLIVGGAATWNTTSAQTPNVTSSLAGTYAKVSDKTFADAGADIYYGLTYNLGGTRGATHTLSCASSPTTSAAKSLSWQEFDSINGAGSPTVGTEASGSSTTPSCQVTVPSGTATVIAIMVYSGSATTATVAVGTQISEADENSDFQDHFIAGSFGQSGTVTITWTLAASRVWHCYAASFPEAGASTDGQEWLGRAVSQRRGSSQVSY